MSNSICLCAIAKNENNYIREWVEHNYSIGFDKIFLYDNNDVDGENFRDVIADFIDNGFVELIDVRGLTNQQIKCYDEFYHSAAAAQYKWVAFFDIDEFLHLNNGSLIRDAVQNPIYNGFDAIVVNWKYYDDNDIIEVKDNNYSIRRFTREYVAPSRLRDPRRFTKRIVRVGVKGCIINSAHGPIDASSLANYSTMIRNNIKVCNLSGMRLPRNRIVISRWSHKEGFLAHYRFKTLDEYIHCKMKRGYPTLFKNLGKDLDLSYYFMWNTMTPEKQEYIDKLGIVYEKK